MTDLSWDQKAQLLEKLVGMELDSRASYLVEFCGYNYGLRSELESLLRAHETGGSFLDQPLIDLLLPANEENSIGSWLGSYQLTRLLGRGELTCVYLGESQKGQRVAIKILHAEKRDIGALRNRLFREWVILTWAKQRSDFIDVFRHETRPVPYMVMEYIDGTNLCQYLEHCRLSPIQRLEIFQKVCDAIGFLHANGVMHLDIKPENILVQGGGNIKILDLGAAERAGCRNVCGASTIRLMTHRYASPEQIRGERLDFSSDVFSLGVLLYEILAREHPYYSSAADMERRTRYATRGVPWKLSEVLRAQKMLSVASLDDELEGRRGAFHGREEALDDLAAKAVAPVPSRRFSNALDLSIAVEELIAGVSLSPVPQRLASKVQSAFWLQCSSQKAG